MGRRARLPPPPATSPPFPCLHRLLGLGLGQVAAVHEGLEDLERDGRWGRGAHGTHARRAALSPSPRGVASPWLARDRGGGAWRQPPAPLPPALTSRTSATSALAARAATRLSGVVATPGRARRAGARAETARPSPAAGPSPHRER